MTVRIVVPGRSSDAPAPEWEQALEQHGIERREVIEVGARRDAGPSPRIEAADEDVLRIEYRNGVSDFVTARELRERLGASRSKDGALRLPTELGPGGTRGGFDWVVDKVQHYVLGKVVEKLADEAGTRAGRELAERIERKHLAYDGAASLRRVDAQLQGLAQDLAAPDGPAPLELPVDEGPLLVLMHGTFSNTLAAFHGLLGTREWQELGARYEKRILALEQKTLSASPVENALVLAQRLPEGARLHLVSHSRGGLVGDLLSLTEVSARARDVFRRRHEETGAAELDALERLIALVKERRLTVERFVRVASPAAGTTLASKRLDELLKLAFNLLKLVPAASVQSVLGLVETFVLAFAGKRADPRVLPGLEAMMPDSPYVHLLNTSARKVAGQLAVVAGDVEKRGFLGSLKVLATDLLLFRGDHDYVVDTRSMYLGLPREDAVAAFQKTADIDHMRYFTDAVARRRVVNALEGWQKGKPPRGFQVLADPAAGVAPDNWTRAAPTDRPRLVLVPAQLASELVGADGQVWPRPSVVAELGVDALLSAELGADDVAWTLYRPLVDRLRNGFAIEAFAYDWRRSAAEAGKRLAARVRELLGASAQQPVHIVAHSGGGLAALWLVAHEPATWKKLRDGGGRLLLLGFPELGSFTALAWMLGQGALPGALSLLDASRSARELGERLAELRGLVELLPHAGPWDCTKAGNWKKLDLAPPAYLAEVKALHDSLAPALEADGVLRVDGSALETLVGCERIPREGRVEGERSLRLLLGPGGDGFAHRSAGGGKSVWTSRAPAAELVSPAHADAISDLLASGTTRRLEAGRAEAPSATRPAPSDLPVGFPTRADLVLAGLGAALAEEPALDRFAMRLEVLCGSLEHARHPVFVGHYEGTPLGGAEAFVDRQLDGLLSEHQLLDRYPGQVGETLVILSEGALAGAVVIGMGEVGELTRPRLAKSVTEGALALALQLLAEPRSEGGARLCAAFSTVLIGSSGRHGMPIESSIAAIVEGAVEANALLEQRGFGDRVRIDAVQLVERYADTADAAVRALRRVGERLEAGLRARFVLEPEPLVLEAAGGLPGSPGESYQEGAWSRLVIEAVPGEVAGEARLEFSSLGRRAKADLRGGRFGASMVDEMIRATIGSSAALRTSNTLFELLVPNDMKAELTDGGNQVLVVDAISARYPWELLAAKGRDGEPVALVDRIGLLRQLREESERTEARAPRGTRALVIGDPPGGRGFPRLPGARREALAVHDLLRRHGYEVDALVSDEENTCSWLEIHDAVFADEHRILHVAAHGVYDASDEHASGVVIGEGRYLTAAAVEKLPVVPELVFLNCCHLAQTGESIAYELKDSRERWNELAASLARAFMLRGARAVIAAGWAIDDEAAGAFAVTLYERMLEGLDYGEAVRQARQAAKEKNAAANTWGAYQCYGAPSFRLASSRSGGGRREGPVSESELLRWLETFTTRASDLGRSRARCIEELEVLELGRAAAWTSGAVDAAFGAACGDLGLFEAAVGHYRKALERCDGGPRIRALEQLANMEVRRAVELHFSVDAEKPKEKAEKVEQLFAAAREHIELADKLHGGRSAECANLLGSFHKKRATTLEELSAREEELHLAKDSYKRAHELRGRPYSTINWVTMRALLPGAVSAEKRGLLAAIVEERRRPPNRRGGMREPGRTFWDRVALPDALLARALAERTLAEDFDEVQGLYAAAFRTRSSWRERGSVLEHLQDLGRLTSDAGQRGLFLRLQEELLRARAEHESRQERA